MMLQDEWVKAEVPRVKNGAKVSLHQEHAGAGTMVRVDQRELHGNCIALLLALIQGNIVRTVLIQADHECWVHLKFLKQQGARNVGAVNGAEIPRWCQTARVV